MQNMITNGLKLEKMIDHLDGSIICCKNDELLTIVYASDYFYKTLGYVRGEVRALLTDYPNSILRNDPPIDWQKLSGALKRTGNVEPEVKLIKKDGHHIWACWRLRLMTEEDGEEYFCGILFDVTRKRNIRKREREQLEAITRAESRLAASEQRYRIIMEQAADPIFDYDLLTHQVYCSPSFQQEFNIEIVDNEDFWDKLLHTDSVYWEDKDQFVLHTRELLSGKQQPPAEYRLKNADNRYRWYRVRSTVICNELGTPIRTITFITDIDNQKKETIRLKEEAEHDLLTGLYNHVTTTGLIDRAIVQSRSDSCHALFEIDIDNFKIVNDKLGHLLGDELLMEIAVELKNQFRENDIIGRMGGDEFVVFLQNINLKTIKLKCNILNEIFRSVRTNCGETCKTSCSVGVALYPKDGSSYSELFRKADLAMYAAKNSGKDTCCIYTGDLEDVSTR
jgi:diguanylate cyclase (GGDEF)-like protein/PAS domain S-box-containing protein